MTHAVWFHLYAEAKKQVNRQNRTDSGNKLMVAGEGAEKERNGWGRWRGANFQLQNKWVTGMRCPAWGI